MGEIKFDGYVVTELDLTNNLTQRGQINLSTRTSYNVQYDDAHHRCVGICTVDMMEDAAPNDFNFKICVKGMFTYEEGMSRKEIHRETYNELFPFVRVIVANTFTNAGIPPIMIQKIKITDDNISAYNQPGDSSKYYS